jgi:hypothetical protein
MARQLVLRCISSDSLSSAPFLRPWSPTSSNAATSSSSGAGVQLACGGRRARQALWLVKRSRVVPCRIREKHARHDAPAAARRV